MKTLLGIDAPATIAFNKTAGTITISDLGQVLTKANMLLIINATRSQIMMNFVDPALAYSIASTSPPGGTPVTTITFGYSTAAMADTDVMQIYVDIQGIEDSLDAFLRRLISLMESNGVVDSSNRQRVIIDAITTAAVTNTTGFGPNVVGSTPGSNTPYAAPTAIPMLTVSEGPVDQRWRLVDSSQASYAVALRGQLSWA
jgi:hypothetical protein